MRRTELPGESSPTSPERVVPAGNDRIAPRSLSDIVQWPESVFKSLFDQAPFYTGILALDGRLIEVGRLALESCGYKRQDVLGKLYWETPWWRGSPETQEKIQAAFNVARAGERHTVVLPYRLADDSSRRMEFVLSPVLGESGAVDCIVIVGTDITDRLKAETELATARQRVNAALVAAEIGTYQWDVLADRLYVDENLAKLFGLILGPDGVAPIGTFMTSIHPDDRERVATRVRRSVETGEDFEEDYRIATDGAVRWVNSRGRMIKDAQGRVVNFFGLVIDITERKHAEQEREVIADRLRRLTAIHETVLSGINDFAYVFDPEGRFLYANRPLLELYGRKQEDVVGKTFSQLGYPDWTAEQHLREIAQVIATRRPIQGEIPFKGESGRAGIFDYIFSPVFGADGRVEAVAGTTRDVTDRRRGEVRDRLLVDLDDATRPLTDPGEITHASARLLGEHLGVNRCAYADVEEDENTFNLTGDFNRDVPSIVGRYRFDQFGAECLRLMRAGEPFVVTDTETDPRTAEVRESYRATIIRSVICVPLMKAGRFVAAMAVHQTTPRSWQQSDIEAVQLIASRCWESIERARVVRVLATSEQRLRLAVEAGRLGAWELELPARTLTSSSTCRAIYGRPPDGVFTFDDMLAAIHPDDRERVQAAIETSLASGGGFELEHRALGSDIQERWVLVRGQTGLGEDGKPARLTAVSLDITARKEAEREQVRLREEAVRASRAKDDFLAALSHELRTPLNPVLLVASDAVQDATLTAEVRQSFEMIRRNVELEARLIDDLLDLTSIVRGKLAIKKEACDLHALLSDALAAVRQDFKEKGVTLTVSLRAHRPEAHADELRIVQVFSNLLKNAVKFTPAGGRVTVETAVEDDGLFSLRVSDTGIGMTPEEISRAFDAFTQGDHATAHGSHRFGGLGLGLAISLRLVELHGGTLSAASPGRDCGTTFTLRLPAHLSEGDGNNQPGVHALSPSGRADASGRRLLLVEDHESTRQALVKLLQKRGYEVVGVGSVAQALASAAAGTFDFVISDLGLPDGDGTALMTELRDRYGLSGVALTGFGMDDDVERCRAAGFTAHLTKPVTVNALDAALRSLPPKRS